MFGIVIGIALLGLAFYELVTREAPAPAPDPVAARVAARIAAARAAAVQSPLATVQLGPSGINWSGPTFAPPGALNPSAAAACYVEAFDWTNTDAWTAGKLGPALSMPARLSLMRSIIPHAHWPAYARRIDCAIHSEPVYAKGE